jgi:hypothetical protein
MLDVVDDDKMDSRDTKEHEDGYNRIKTFCRVN